MLAVTKRLLCATVHDVTEPARADGDSEGRTDDN